MHVTKMATLYLKGEINATIDHAMKTVDLESLKREQREAIQEFLSGKDIFVSLPTGYGKTYCYSLLPLAFDYLRESQYPSIAICVSPLTALMMEQRAKMSMKGVASEFVGELQQDVDALEGVKKGQLQLLYISPESLLRNSQWRELLLSKVYSKNLVIDEAHCVTKWGSSFREDYSKLSEVRSLIPISVHVMALTATATATTQAQIIATLCMDKPHVLSVSPHKKNIVYVVKKKSGMEVVENLARGLKNLRTEMPRIIMFCKRYDECSRMYRLFKYYLRNLFTEPPGAPNLPKFRLVDMYTKCTEGDVKETIVESFCNSSGKLRIVIGTITFGMGLDCPNIRQIILWGPPSDFESFIQQTGRGGRDGLLSCALTYYTDADHRWASEQMMEYCRHASTCGRKTLFQDFDNFSDLQWPCKPCLCCDVCMQSCSCESCCGNHKYMKEVFKHKLSFT